MPSKALPGPVGDCSVSLLELGTIASSHTPVASRNEREPRKSLPALTGLRFFAAGYVVVFHTDLPTFLTRRGHPFSGNFFANGYLAVPLFFLLSGFVLAYNYRGRINTGGHVVGFWEARFARIWPAYVFSLVGCSVVVATIPSWRLALATLTMVQAWNPYHPEYAGAWNGVCWSLSVEAFFYLLFPALQTAIEKLRPLLLAFSALLLMALCATCDTAFHTLNRPYAGIFFYLITPVIQLPEFLTGMVLGNLFLQSDRFSALPWSAAATALPLWSRGKFPMITWVGFSSSIAALTLVGRQGAGLVIITFSLLLYGLAMERSLFSRFLSTPALILGGEISYSMYLLRTPLHEWINLVPAFGQNEIVKLLHLPLALIPLSLFSYHVVEGPSRRGLRHVFAKLHALRA